MNALSLEPPGRKGAVRGCGSAEFDCVVEDATDDAGGERMNPPVRSPWASIIGRMQ